LPEDENRKITLKKDKLLSDIPRITICLVAILLAGVYYYIFDCAFDMAPYDARLTSTAVFMNFDKSVMHVSVYMFYENKNKNIERKQFLLFPFISDRAQKNPDSVEFKEKVLNETFSFEETGQEITIEGKIDTLPGSYKELAGEFTDYGSRIWLNLKPSEKKLVKATFSQSLSEFSSGAYRFKYEFSNSKAWGVDLTDVFYFISLPYPYIIKETDIMDRKTAGERMDIQYWRRNLYQQHLCRLGALTKDKYGKLQHRQKELIPPSYIMKDRCIYIIQYKKGYDPGLGIDFEASSSRGIFMKGAKKE